jgi:hypothetical protein
MNDTTELNKKPYSDGIYISPEADWQRSEPIKLTPKMIAAIEYMVIIRQYRIEKSPFYYIELVISGKRYWDIPGEGQFNQFKNWIPIIECFPTHTAIQIDDSYMLWATARSWQK